MESEIIRHSISDGALKYLQHMFWSKYDFFLLGTLNLRGRCFQIFLNKRKWSFYTGAILLYQQFIHLTQITLRPITAFEYSAACLPFIFSYFLFLFRLQYCGKLGEF